MINHLYRWCRELAFIPNSCGSRCEWSRKLPIVEVGFMNGWVRGGRDEYLANFSMPRKLGVKGALDNNMM